MTAEASVLQLFEISAKGQIVQVAGCRVTEGTIVKGKVARVIRRGIIITEGPLFVVQLWIPIHILTRKSRRSAPP